MEGISIARIKMKKASGIELVEAEDELAVEEPLEIELAYGDKEKLIHKVLSVTMRTPGNDEDLAVGFLFTEGIIKNKEAIQEIKQLSFDENRTLVTLHENIQPDLANVSRNFYSTSSCGICGKASIEAIRTISYYGHDENTMSINASVLYHLQDNLKKHQVVFENTGGIHASALFSLNGNFIMLREDVGRHNALDKIIGAALIEDQLPLSKHILFLSGRAGFELVQKALMAGIKIIAAVGAPSSLAVELAKEGGLTLIGFLRNNRFNIYSGDQRIVL